MRLRGDVGKFGKCCSRVRLGGRKVSYGGGNGSMIPQ